MLSYRHVYHAGNFADVLKHILLVEIIQYLKQKEKGFHYIDTHAGAGRYSLDDARALQGAEFRGGIGRLAGDPHPALAAYLSLVGAQSSTADALHSYPGSPALAAQLLRRQDRGWFFELHPADAEALRGLFVKTANCVVTREDGLAGLLRLLPPVTRRAVVLIDPAYEREQEYAEAGRTLAAAWQKFPQGHYLLWYPVIRESSVDALLKPLLQTGVRRLHRYELSIGAPGPVGRMTRSAMLIINPPWNLADRMVPVLRQVATSLAGESGSVTHTVLAEE